MNSIYKHMDKIDDSKSLNEKWNVKNQRELKKLMRESIEGSEEAIEFAREYILDQYSYNDYDFEETNTEFLLTLWCGDFEDESEVTYKMSIEKLVELKDDETAFEEYIDSCENFVDYEAAGDEFYRRAEEELNKYFNCTGAFLEPSTQLGQGRTFLFADDMRFDGSFDFQTGEDYIRENNFEGFLELCKDSFTVVTEESLNENAETSNAVMRGMDKVNKNKSSSGKGNVKNQRKLKKLKENFTVYQYTLTWDGEYECADEESFDTKDEAQSTFNELKELIDKGEFYYDAISLEDEDGNEIATYGKAERGCVTKEDVIEYLRDKEEVRLTDQEFDYVVEDLWDAISREMREGSIYETIDDVNMGELIDASDNPTHDLCYKLMGLLDDDELE